jgi:hypothetical protein
MMLVASTSVAWPLPGEARSVPDTLTLAPAARCLIWVS